eukprot:jgi/Mesvir1/23712/Mv18659-RA.1
MASSDDEGERPKRKEKKGKKRSRTDVQPGPVQPPVNRTSQIKNKHVREDEMRKLKKKRKETKKRARELRKREEERALELGEEPPPKKIPKTIENTREADETVIQPDDEEVMQALATDEFAGHFNREHQPKVLITTCHNPTKVMYTFVKELLSVLPCAFYYRRGDYHIKEICKYASNRGFTDVMVFNENRKDINGLLLVHLPDGPTAHFRLTSYVPSKKIKGHGKATRHRPELILNNFSTALGNRVGRMFASLFHQDPHFRGRRAVTFHNQRDFIFFRHHRYIFEPGKEGKKDQPRVIARLQELGPRFTLKLQSLQKGTFDSKHGEYEWVQKSLIPFGFVLSGTMFARRNWSFSRKVKPAAAASSYEAARWLAGCAAAGRGGERPSFQVPVPACVVIVEACVAVLTNEESSGVGASRGTAAMVTKDLAE